MARDRKVVVAGHICLDIIPEIDHAFDLVPGRLFEVGEAKLCTGGAVSNTGLALNLLGVPTKLAGKIGDDDFGHSILRIVREYSEAAAEGMIVEPGAVSSYTVVVNIPGADRVFLHCPGANHTFGAADVGLDALADCALLHFGYPTLMARTFANDGEELVALMRKVKDAGLTTSLDMTVPDPNSPSGKADWRRILQRTLPHVDVYLPSADETLYMLDRDRFGTGDGISGDAVSTLGAQLVAMGVAVAGLKVGSRGLYVRTAAAERLQAMGRGKPADPGRWAERELWFPVYSIPGFAGATGAGDTTIAGFLAAMLDGRSLRDCGRFANAVGSCNVQASDALSGLKSWEETWALLDEGWATDPLEVDGEGWRRDPASGMWEKSPK
jgi:sugar/nucleoside kinase (ribokinase family)